MTPTPLEQPTGPALYRQACEVMGYEVESDPADYSPDFTHVQQWHDEKIYMTDHWNVFGLIVAWIEARGCSTCHGKTKNGYKFGVSPVLVTGAPTLPEAAARWVCEHGHKIAKEQGP